MLRRSMASALLDRPSTTAAPAPSRPAWLASPRLSRAELGWAVIAAVALAVLTSWPLLLHMSSRIAPDNGDPVRTAWQIAWVGHALLHEPLHLFDSNAFYPHPLSLAFSDSLLRLMVVVGITMAGVALLAIPVVAVLKAYNLYRFVEGLATMVILMLFLGGIQLIGMGLLGAYVGRTYEETKRRPKFIVDESLGFERPPAEDS